MADWLSPPPPPPHPSYPLVLGKDRDGEDSFTRILLQIVFVFFMVACQHPQLLIGPCRGFFMGLQEWMERALAEAVDARRERRENAAYQRMHDDEESGAAAPSGPEAARRPRVRVVLHSKLAKFQSRLDGLMMRQATPAGAPAARTPPVVVGVPTSTATATAPVVGVRLPPRPAAAYPGTNAYPGNPQSAVATTQAAASGEAPLTRQQLAMLNQLVSMGFEATQARAALERSNWDLVGALALLLEQGLA